MMGRIVLHILAQTSELYCHWYEICVVGLTKCYSGWICSLQ